MFVGQIFGPDLLIVVIVGAVLLFGGAAIPKFARNLGQTKTEFEKGMRSVNEPGETAKISASTRDLVRHDPTSSGD